MRTVRDESGRRLLLVKRSTDASLVRDPETGTERYVENDRLSTAKGNGESPLETAAAGVPDSVRRVLSATRDDRSLGLLVEVVDRGPVGVRELLDTYDLCESELHGLLGEFTAAGLFEQTRVLGERGYAPTDAAIEATAILRGTDPTPSADDPTGRSD